MLRTCSPIVALTLYGLTPSFARADPPTTTQVVTTSSADDRNRCTTTRVYCHDGFYARYTLAFGYAALLSRTAATDSNSGRVTSATLALGGTPARGFVVGGVLGANLSSAFRSPHAGAFIDLYPVASGGWHTGIAVEVQFVVLGSAGRGNVSGLGPAATLFAGYDWWIGPQWSLGLFASASAGATDTMLDLRGRDTGLRFAPVGLVLGAALLFH